MSCPPCRAGSRINGSIGERAGLWALHVTKNWRITVIIDHNEIDIYDLDYEDYH